MDKSIKLKGIVELADSWDEISTKNRFMNVQMNIMANPCGTTNDKLECGYRSNYKSVSF